MISINILKDDQTQKYINVVAQSNLVDAKPHIFYFSSVREVLHLIMSLKAEFLKFQRIGVNVIVVINYLAGRICLQSMECILVKGGVIGLEMH